MELAVNTIECSQLRSTWRLHHLTDLHIDDVDHADRELRQRVKEIEADDNALWLGGGDNHSLILPGDKRFSTPMKAGVHHLPDVYVERCEELLDPVAAKCVGLGIGNHEMTVEKHYHRGVGAEIASRLGCPEKYLGVRGWSILRFKLHTRVVVVRLYQYHGWSAGRLRGRKAIQAERDVGAWRADAFFLGHDHQPYQEVFWTQECVGTKTGYKLRNRPVAVINGGSWTYGQRTPSTAEEKRARKMSEVPNETWAEGRNFRPQSPVSPILEIHVDFGGAKDKSHLGRPSGFAFETRMLAPSFDV